MQFSNAVQSVTRTRIVPMVYDGVLKGSPMLLRTIGNSKGWGSGTKLEKITKYKKSTLGGVIDVNDKLDTSRQDTRVKIEFEPKGIHKPVAVGKIETSVNKGSERVLELLATEFDSVMLDLIEDVAGQVFEGTGSGKQWDSLLNYSDDATNYASYGGQSRSTYPHLAGDLTTGVGAIALSNFSTLHDAISFNGITPSIMPTTRAVFTALEGVLQPHVSFNATSQGYAQVTRTGQAQSRRALGGDIGFDALYYRGCPVAKDDLCPTGFLYALDEKYFDFYGVNIDGYNRPKLKGTHDSPNNNIIPAGFNWSGLMSPTDQLADVGHLLMLGDFIGCMPRGAGRLEEITC